MIAVDFDALQASTAALGVSLLANRTVHEDTLTGVAVTGFDAVAAIDVVAKVAAVRGTVGKTLNVTVEGSTDGGSTWVPVAGCDFDFTANGTQRVSVDSPPDQLRVVLTPGEANTSATVSIVRAVPHFLEKRVLSLPDIPTGDPADAGKLYVDDADGFTIKVSQGGG